MGKIPIPIGATGFAALTSGRACLRAILERTPPQRVFVPFYICDSVLEPIRRRMFRMMGYGGVGIDISPLLLILAIYFVDFFLVGTLSDIGMRLR